MIYNLYFIGQSFSDYRFKSGIAIFASRVGLDRSHLKKNDRFVLKTAKKKRKTKSFFNIVFINDCFLKQSFVNDR